MNAINKNFINLVNLSKFGGPGPAVFLDTIDSVSDMLQEIGYQTKISSNIILNDAINILWGVGSVFSPTYEEIAAIATPKNSIIFNMEQLGSNSPFVTQEYLKFISRYIIFDYNYNNLNFLDKSQTIHFEFPLLPSKKFVSDYKNNFLVEKEFDLAFYGHINPRRLYFIEELKRQGLSINLISGLYSSDLSSELLKSTAVLNIHNYDSGIFEIARCLRPLAMGIPIFSEKSAMPLKIKWENSGVFFFNKNSLDSCKLLLNNPKELLTGVQRSLNFINLESNKLILNNLFNEVLNYF
jgi:hypothetical protein